jgi:hypothetical protein
MAINGGIRDRDLDTSAFKALWNLSFIDIITLSVVVKREGNLPFIPVFIELASEKLIIPKRRERIRYNSR